MNSSQSPMSGGNSGMDSLIPLVNRLQDAFSAAGVEMGLELPQIAVVGCQSAGKSSVLENFVGRDFLPRGSGIVTRRPLVLKLINSNDEYGIFLHVPTKRFAMNQIRDEIVAETERETGTNKGISSRPINLTIYSPNVLNLTLIDLPGLTRVAVGDQPSDISRQIHDMVLSYISHENCLILAVSPANADLANSDALRVAMGVDPEGTRTIGVITKLDLMDSGTDAKEILENKVLPLRRGYIGVVNRSQESITKNKPIEMALAEEQSFFHNHPIYSHLSNKSGTAYLQKFLNRELSCHIRKHLPSLKTKLEHQLRQLENQAEEFEGLGFSTDRQRRDTVTKLSADFNRNFNYALKGFGSIAEQEKLLGGARIKFLYFKKYNELLHAVSDLLSDNQIGYIIENCHAVHTGMFTPDKAFRDVVRIRIEHYKSPSFKILEEVTDELFRLTDECFDKILAFPALRESLYDLSRNKIIEASKKAKIEIDMFVEAQKDYINTKHPDMLRYCDSRDLTVDDLERSNPHNSSDSSSQQTLWEELADDRSGSPVSTDHHGQSLLPNGPLVGEATGGGFGDAAQGGGRSSPSTIFDKHKVHHHHHRRGKMKPSDDSKKRDNRDMVKDSSMGAAPPLPPKDSSAGGARRGFPTPPSHNTSTIRSRKSTLEIDDILDQQIRALAQNANAYLKIINVQFRDIIPKYINFHLLKVIQDYFAYGLITDIYELDLETIVKPSDDEVSRQKRIIDLRDATSEALKILSTTSANIPAVKELPPPITRKELNRQQLLINDEATNQPQGHQEAQQPRKPSLPQRPVRTAPVPR